MYYKIIHEIKGKTFYLFGETHKKKEQIKCNYDGEKMEFIDYILQLSRTTTSFIDIYIELGLFKKINKQYTEIIGDYALDSFMKKIIKDSKIQLLEKNFFELYKDFFNALLESESVESELESESVESELESVESESETDINPLSSSYTIDTFFDTLINCIQPSTRDADICKLFRIHSVDVRNSYNNINIGTTDYFFIIIKILNCGLDIPKKISIIRYTGGLDNLLKKL